MDSVLPLRPSAAGHLGEGLLSSLCRDVVLLRRRAQQLTAQLERSQDPGLLARLRRELAGLGGRRAELQRIAAQLRRGRPQSDSLNLLLLEELTRRPLVASAG